MQISIADLLKIPIIKDFDLDQNGRFIIYSSNESGAPQLYSLPTEPGSKARQITRGKDPVLGGVLSPQGDRLIYPQDNDGNEIHHLFLMPIEGEEARRLTETPYRTFDLDWHPSGREITRAFASKKSCGLETCNLDTGEWFMLKEPSPPLMDVQYSHDGRWIACTMAISFSNTQVLIIDRDDPSDTIIYSLKDNSKEGLPSWSPDDRKLAFASDARGKGQVVIQEFQGEERTFLELEENEEVAPSMGRAVWSPKSDKVYYVVSRHSRTTIHGHPLDGGKESALPFPKGTVELPEISKDGRIIVALHSSMISPYGIYMHKIGSETTTPISGRKFMVDLTRLARPQSIWYNTFDERRIHGWYMPSALEATPHPAVMSVHGGPWGQVFDNWFEGLFLHFVSQNGFAGFAPNFRGSTGYGAEFQNLDIGDVGGGDLEDVVCGAKWLRRQPNIDDSKIAIMGASYGGYMTLMALTRKPEIFAVGISFVPVVDWTELYELSDPAFRMFEETILGGSPSEKEALYRDRSPITHIENIRAPVMIMAGEKDSRCPIRPIRKFVRKLEEMNHPHQFVLEEKAGHISAFLNWEESIPLAMKIVDYLRNALA